MGHLASGLRGKNAVERYTAEAEGAAGHDRHPHAHLRQPLPDRGNGRFHTARCAGRGLSEGASPARHRAHRGGAAIDLRHRQPLHARRFLEPDQTRDQRNRRSEVTAAREYAQQALAHCEASGANDVWRHATEGEAQVYLGLVLAGAELVSGMMLAWLLACGGAPAPEVPCVDTSAAPVDDAVHVTVAPTWTGEQAMAAAAVALASRGTMRTTTMQAIPVEDLVAALSRPKD